MGVSYFVSIILWLEILFFVNFSKGLTTTNYDLNIDNSEHLQKFMTFRDAVLNPTSILLANPFTTSVGAVYFNNSITFSSTSNFSTHFSFIMDQQSSDGGDGFAFILNRDPFTTFPQHDDQFYYGNLHVYFRTYLNNDYTLEVRVRPCNQSILYLDPISGCSNLPLLQFINSIYRGTVRQYAWVDYSWTNQILEIRMNQVDVKPSAPLSSVQLDLSPFFGQQLYVGYSAVSRSQFARHRVLGSLQFFHNSDPCSMGINGGCSINAFCYSSESYGRSCICHSGYDGDGLTCSLSSCPLALPQKLVTQPIAELLVSKSKLNNNHFSFEISSSVKLGRRMNLISLQNENIPECNFPGPHFQKVFDGDGCSDIFKGNFTFQQVVSCGFQVSAANQLNNTHYIYDGYIKVDGTDTLGSLRNLNITRKTSTMISVSLVLPKSISFTISNLTFHSEANVESAIAKQDYYPSVDSNSIEILTSVQWPYKLDTPSLVSNLPRGLLASAINIEDFSCINGQPCTQKLVFNISGAVSSQICHYNGNYEINLSIVCNPDYLNCFNTNGKYSSISFNLQSGTVCSSIQINANLFGNLLSYSDSGFQSPKSYFIAGETIFLKSQVQSSVTIDSVSLQNLVIRYNQTFSKTLRLFGQTQQLGLDVNFSSSGFSYTPSSNEILFSFETLIGKLFPESDRDAVITFDIEADLTVDYRTTFGKRDVQSQSLSTSQKIIFQNKRNTKKTSIDQQEIKEIINGSEYLSSSSLIKYLFVSLFCFLL